MASSYTSSYQLCQWEAGDKVLRTDFNSDNTKIDAALKPQADAITAKAAQADLEELEEDLASEVSARAAGDLYVKLLDVTTSSAQAQADFDVNGIDFTQYAEIKLYVDFGSCNEIMLRVNEEDSYTKLPISGSDQAITDYTSNYLALFDGISTNPWAFLQFNCPRTGTAVRCLCVTACGRYYTGYQIASGVSWTGLTSFNLVPLSGSGTVPAGTRFVLYGLKL